MKQLLNFFTGMMTGIVLFSILLALLVRDITDPKKQAYQAGYYAAKKECLVFISDKFKDSMSVEMDNR